jgi:hypothetical protein
MMDDYKRDLSPEHEARVSCTFHHDRTATALLQEGSAQIPVCTSCWLIRNPQAPVVGHDVLYRLFQRGAIDRAEYDELAARLVQKERRR